MDLYFYTQLNICAFQCQHLYGPYLDQFSAGTAPSSACAIWDEFRKQHQHQGIKSTILITQLTLFWCN